MERELISLANSTTSSCPAASTNSMNSRFAAARSSDFRRFPALILQSAKSVVEIRNLVRLTNRSTDLGDCLLDRTDRNVYFLEAHTKR